MLCLELKLKARDLYALLLPAVFFLCFMLLLVLTLDSDSSKLVATISSICWLATLLSLILHLDRLFRDDYEQGALDLLISGEINSYTLILARMVAHWLLIALPLCLLAVLLGLLFSVPVAQLYRLLAALLCGSALLVTTGTVIASLCIGVSRATMLIGILLVPLLTPVVIFGIAASRPESGGWQLVLLLFGGVCINLVIAPLLCHAALHRTID